jgi:hypothetical protein
VRYRRIIMGVAVDGDVSVEYLSAGANRQTAVADWSKGGVLAFGADTNVALWRPSGVSPPDQYYICRCFLRKNWS